MEAVKNRPRLHELWPSWALGAALVALFFGERVFAASNLPRALLDGFAALAVLAAVGFRAKELNTASREQEPVARLLFICSAGVLLSLVVYALIPLVFSSDKMKNAAAIAWAVWPTLLACAALPIAAVEIATAPVAHNERYELTHVHHAFQRGLGLALLVGVLFFANFLSARHELKSDLSYGQKALASDTTRHAIRDLSADVEVVLFFPRANEVEESLEPYFDSIKSLSPHLKIKHVDVALASQLARDAGVTENGFVALMHDKAKDKIRVGDKFPAARGNMRKFDANFLTSLNKVTKEKKTAYFTVGHEERTSTPGEKDTRPALRDLKRFLDAEQYTVRNLGIAEGLADKVPADASVVFIMGPERPFSQPEIDAINKAIARGTRVFIALEAERDGDPLDGILNPLGLKFDKTILGNEAANVQLTRTDADHAIIWSNRYSSHESVTTMTRNQRLATIFQKTGSLSKLDDKAADLPKNQRTDIVLTAVDNTFADANGNLAFDQGEKKVPFGLAAAVTRTATTGKRSDEGRVFVLADVDALADVLLRNEGNVYLAADILYWLRTVDEPVLPPVSAEDVQIVHRKDEDTVWFYGTTLGVPALVLAIGLLSVGGRRRS